MENTGLNNPLQDHPNPNELLAPQPGTSDKNKAQPEDLKPTSKGVENAKKRLRAFSIQKKSSLSPIPPPKTICTTVGSVGTVFIGKLATSKPVLKPGDIEEVVDPKKPPKPPKPGTSKLQNADYLNIQKKTLSEIEAMKRKMELVDLGIPLGLICPVSNSDKAMPTKAMPPIKSMLLDPAKVDEIIREAKQAKAEGKSFKFSYEKLLPSYQNPFQKSKDKDNVPSLPVHDHRQNRDRRKYTDKFRRYTGHKDGKRRRDWRRDEKERMRANIIRERENREQKVKYSKEKSRKDVKSKSDGKSKGDVKSKGFKTKEKIDTIHLSDEDDDDVQVIGEIPNKNIKEADVNLKDFVVCDSWSENEEKVKDSTPINDDKGKEDSKTTPDPKFIDSFEQLKQSLIKEVVEPPVDGRTEKLQPVTDSFKYEVEDEHDDEETLDMFAESTSIKKVAKQIPKLKTHKKNLYDSPVPIRFDYNDDNNSNDAMDESFLESVIAEIKQEDIDEDMTQDKALVEYDISPKEDERESVTPELDDRIREMYSIRSDNSDGYKSVESVKSTESGFKSTESGYKSTESGYKSTESLQTLRGSSVKAADSPKMKESRHKSVESCSKSTESHKSTESRYKSTKSSYKSRESLPKLKDSSVKPSDSPKLNESRLKSIEVRSKSSESHKVTDSGNKPTESGYKSNDTVYKSTESLPKLKESSVTPTDSPKSNERRHKSIEIRSKSTDSHKSMDSNNKLAESYHRPEIVQRSTKNESAMLSSIETPRDVEVNMSKSTVDSLETWSFVLKICQPLLFRHDKSKCYRESPGEPKVWWCENPKLCDCVKDRSVVYEELEMCKMELVDSVYGTHQVQEAVYPEARGWYPAAFLAESGSLPLTSEWEAEDSQERPTPPPHTRDEMVLDREYQKFMEAVWPDVEGAAKSETPRSTPVRDTIKRPGEEPEAVAKKKKIKLSEGKLSSEGWSQESEVEEDLEKNNKQKVEKRKRKRKHSTSISTSEGETPSKKKKKKALKKEKKEKGKSKGTKRQRLNKKYLKKLKEKQQRQLKRKKLAKMEESDADEQEKERKKKEKKLKQKKLLKLKKKSSKKSKAKNLSSSSSESEPRKKSKKKEKRKKRNKSKQSNSDSNPSQEFYEDDILLAMKSEIMTDDETPNNFSPNKIHREIINVKQLQNDFVSIQIKKEIEDVNSPDEFEESFTEEERNEMKKQEVEKAEVVKTELESTEAKIIEPEVKVEDIEVKEKETAVQTLEVKDEHEFKEPECTRPLTPQLKPHPDENNSQCSSQESITSVKPYEKDDSHLRPSSQNSNYNFHDVILNESHVGDSELYAKDAEMEMEGGYEQGNYEMYEQMAMEYQSDVASQRVPPPDEQTSGRIETVVMSRTRGEIKCDWRAGDPADPPAAPPRPSRWQDRPPPTMDTPQRPSRWDLPGQKPNEVNIVLTGGNEEQTEEFHIESVQTPIVYKIQSLANRTDNSNSGYDEAYMDMYGASDRLQYGDCFSRESAKMEVEKKPVAQHSSSLDDRINLALRTTVLGDVANDITHESEGPATGGILITKSLGEVRNVKRVSFADGYKPGQDSDTEDPPIRKRKKVRRTGCPWPCPASHRDHVSLWDALPPPPPPPGSPPPPAHAPPPPASLLRAHRTQLPMLRPPHPNNKFDLNSLAAFMPPEPPPGLISF